MNIRQGNSSQLFAHLLRDILKARGAQVEQKQKEKKIRVCRHFKSPSPTLVAQLPPFSNCFWAQGSEVGTTLLVWSGVWRNESGVASTTQAWGQRNIRATAMRSPATVLQLSLPAATTAGLWQDPEGLLDLLPPQQVPGRHLRHGALCSSRSALLGPGHKPMEKTDQQLNFNVAVSVCPS